MKVVNLVLLVVTVAVVVLSVLLHIIAMASSTWIRSGEPGTLNRFMNIGLTTACFHKYTHPHETPAKLYDGCHSLDSDTYASLRQWLVPSWLVSAYVLSIFALLLQLAGCLLFALFLFWVILGCTVSLMEKNLCQTVIIYATPIVYIVAAVFVMMPVMIFGDNAFRLQCRDFWLDGGDPFVNELGWSWYCEVFATIFSFIAGILLVCCVVRKAKGIL